MERCWKKLQCPNDVQKLFDNGSLLQELGMYKNLTLKKTRPWKPKLHSQAFAYESLMASIDNYPAVFGTCQKGLDPSTKKL